MPLNIKKNYRKYFLNIVPQTSTNSSRQSTCAIPSEHSSDRHTTLSSADAASSDTETSSFDKVQSTNSETPIPDFTDRPPHDASDSSDDEDDDLVTGNRSCVHRSLVCSKGAVTPDDGSSRESFGGDIDLTMIENN